MKREYLELKTCRTEKAEFIRGKEYIVLDTTSEYTYEYDTAGDIGLVIPINEVKPFLNSSNERTLLDIKNEMAPKEIPANLKAWPVSSTEVRIQWDSVQNVDGYYLYYSADQKTWKPYYDDINETYLLEWLSDYSAYLPKNKPNDTVYFKIAVVKDGIEGTLSNVISTTTLDKDIYFPLLADVPMPVGLTCNDYLLNEDETIVAYTFSKDIFNYDAYLTLLNSYGWKFSKESKDDEGNPIVTYVKGDYEVSIGWIDGKRAIVGYIR